MGVVIRERHFHLTGNHVGFGDFLGIQSFAFERVHEISVAAKVELISPIQADPPLLEQIRQHAMGDRSSDL
jgi:hypothetical protein